MILAYNEDGKIKRRKEERRKEQKGVGKEGRN